MSVSSPVVSSSAAALSSTCSWHSARGSPYELGKVHETSTVTLLEASWCAPTVTESGAWLEVTAELALDSSEKSSCSAPSTVTVLTAVSVKLYWRPGVSPLKLKSLTVLPLVIWPRPVYETVYDSLRKSPVPHVALTMYRVIVGTRPSVVLPGTCQPRSTRFRW